MSEQKFKCSRCGSEISLNKHINKCKCGARIKILNRRMAGRMSEELTHKATQKNR